MLLVSCLESGFTGFRGLQRTSLFWAEGSFLEDYFTPFFSPMRNAAAGGRVMKVSFNSYLPTQPGDVIVNPRNPVNPDSKPIFAIIFNLKPVGEKTMRASRLYFREVWIILGYLTDTFLSG